MTHQSGFVELPATAGKAAWNDEEVIKMAPLAIRAWLQLSLSPAEMKLLGIAVICLAVLSGKAEPCVNMASKLGILDILESLQPDIKEGYRNIAPLFAWAAEQP